ncbi:MAG: hypothetical protein IAG13_31770 [Deltaproteobacteria bacterium]|nr:hypothetical protein [Nannocystaceae bacterium]
MKRNQLLAALFVCACDAKPSLFGTEDDDPSTGGETDTVGDGEAVRVAWTHELPGYALQAEADADGAVFMTRTYDIERALYRIGADGQILEVIDLAASASDFTWGERQSVVEVVENGGYRLRPLGDSASETMPGWPRDLQLGLGEALRVAGVLYEDEQTLAYLDIYTPGGMLAATWTQPYDESVLNVHIIDDGTSQTSVVWVHRRDDGTDNSIGTISQVGIDGTMLATRTIDLAGDFASVPLPHPDGWMIVGGGVFGLWTQVVPADLSEPGPRVFDAAAIDRPLFGSVALHDGVLAITARDVEGRSHIEARRYAFDGTLIGTTLLPFYDPSAVAQTSYAWARSGDAVYIAGWDSGPDLTEWVGWVTRLDL